MMETSIIKLGISGFLKKDKLEIASSLKLPIKGNNYFMFANFSDHTIPVGSIFHSIEINGEYIPCELELVGVTQQYNKSIDEISRGWKTIILINSISCKLEDLVEINEIEDWFDSPVHFYLCMDQIPLLET